MKYIVFLLIFISTMSLFGDWKGPTWNENKDKSKLNIKSNKTEEEKHQKEKPKQTPTPADTNDFKYPGSKELKSLLADYAKLSCRISDTGESPSAARSLDEEESQKIASCFSKKLSTTKDSLKTVLQKTANNPLKKITDKTHHCTINLFEKSSQKISCSEPFILLGISAAKGVIKTSETCSGELESYGENATSILCPVGKTADLKIKGHTLAFYTRGKCTSNSKGCLEIKDHTSNPDPKQPISKRAPTKIAH